MEVDAQLFETIMQCNFGSQHHLEKFKSPEEVTKYLLSQRTSRSITTVDCLGDQQNDLFCILFSDKESGFNVTIRKSQVLVPVVAFSHKIRMLQQVFNYLACPFPPPLSQGNLSNFCIRVVPPQSPQH